MHLSARYGLAGIVGLALLTAVQKLRDLAWSPPPPGEYLLGVLPDFAAAIAIAFVLLSIWSDQNRTADPVKMKRAFMACVLISGFGLLAWELFQKTSTRLVFDPHDIGATFLGLGAAYVLFRALTPQSSLQARPW